MVSRGCYSLSFCQGVHNRRGYAILLSRQAGESQEQWLWSNCEFTPGDVCVHT